jgi:hypothetical protein
MIERDHLAAERRRVEHPRTTPRTLRQQESLCVLCDPYVIYVQSIIGPVKVITADYNW